MQIVKYGTFQELSIKVCACPSRSTRLPRVNCRLRAQTDVPKHGVITDSSLKSSAIFLTHIERLRPPASRKKRGRGWHRGTGSAQHRIGSTLSHYIAAGTKSGLKIRFPSQLRRRFCIYRPITHRSAVRVGFLVLVQHQVCQHTHKAGVFFGVRGLPPCQSKKWQMDFIFSEASLFPFEFSLRLRIQPSH